MERPVFSHFKEDTNQENMERQYRYVDSENGRESIYDRRYSKNDDDGWIEPEVEKDFLTQEEIAHIKKSHIVMYILSIALCFTPGALFGFISLVFCLKADPLMKKKEYKEVERCNSTSLKLCILGIISIFIALMLSIGAGIVLYRGLR